jgi:hypothetical protein
MRGIIHRIAYAISVNFSRDGSRSFPRFRLSPFLLRKRDIGLRPSSRSFALVGVQITAAPRRAQGMLRRTRPRVDPREAMRYE